MKGSKVSPFLRFENLVKKIFRTRSSVSHVPTLTLLLLFSLHFLLLVYNQGGVCVE